ncbi:MAG: TIGR00730 family Rossman fold protein [Ilumatobacteraceae bacterium]|nr:TIGR00730 family Rossman fold protein [Ilumatobacteraceae bacterium]
MPAARHPRDQKLLDKLIATVHRLSEANTGTLDLKIASSALDEMAEAFAMFAPYRDSPKVTIFGSARTTASDPLYDLTAQVARKMADNGWMVVTGAGPGIMEAGMLGAGRQNSIGVSIRLPFETSANPIIEGDDKYVSMQYFFTRKLMLLKESRAFLCLPGGFGTLDEMFELLTLMQTGKGVLAPTVLLDLPGDPFWEGVSKFINSELIPRRLVSAADLELFRVTNSVNEAVEEIIGFYSNYHSLRSVRDVLVIRLQRSPTAAQLGKLNEQFAHLCRKGTIKTTGPLKVEVNDDDFVLLPRISFSFGGREFGELRRLINVLNTF